jgi:hypothetical protein
VLVGCAGTPHPDPAHAVAVTWRIAPADGRDVEVSLVVDGHEQHVGRLRADGARAGSPKTCALRLSTPTEAGLSCGYTTDLNYFAAELVGGDLVVTLHTGFESEGDGPIENPPIEMLRVAAHGSRLVVAPYEQTFAEALDIVCRSERLVAPGAEARSVAMASAVDGLVSNPQARELLQAFGGMTRAQKTSALRTALATTAIARCELLDAATTASNR